MKAKPVLIGATITLLVAGCDDTKQIGTNMTDLEFEDPFVSDVIGIKEVHLSPDYWITSDMHDVIMSPSEITAFNKANINGDPTLFNIRAQPDSLGQKVLTQFVRSISKTPGYPRIYSDGIKVTEADFECYESALNLDAIRSENHVRLGLTVRRTSIRTYPTHDLLFSHDAENRDIDRFQESVLFPGDAVAVLHESADGQWALIQSYNYVAWAPLADIAIGSRSEVFDYVDQDKFLVATGDKVLTAYNPDVPAVSELQLDMGVKVPLSRPKELAYDLYGQNPYLSHMVLLPVRMVDGQLDFKHALIQRKADVHVGYLPYTQANIIKQAFKFLGERYGWGHRYNGRDCTGFVSEIYKSFGILLPRNSGDQVRSDIGITTRFDDNVARSFKINRLETGFAGDILYMPGHVLMLLGTSGGEPFVIHDVTGLGYLRQDGTFYKGTLNGVSVTKMLPLQSKPKRTYLDTVFAVKTIK